MARHKWKIAGGAVGAVCVVFACLWAFVSSQTFMVTAAEQAGALAEDALETKVEIGQLQVKSWNSLEVAGFNIYDKQSQLIAHVDVAELKISPLGMLTASVPEGISEININKADVNILQREDGTWNYEDLLSDSESETKFTAKINVQDSTLRTNYNNQDVVLENVHGSLDMADYPGMQLAAACENQGAQAEVAATFAISDFGEKAETGSRQTFQLTLRDADLQDYLPYLPEGTIPEDVFKDIAGHVTNLQLAGERIGESLFFRGQLELTDGKCVLLEEHQLENIRASATFNEHSADVFVSAESQGQSAAARGKVDYNLSGGGMPTLDLTVTSAAFDAGKIFPDIPYEGAVSFTAHVKGVANDPRVDARIDIPSGKAWGVPFSDLSARISYADSMVTANRFKAVVAGGRVESAGSFDAQSYDFAGTVDVKNVSAYQVGELVNSLDGDGSLDLTDLGGIVSCKVVLSGNANDFANVQGNATVNGKSLTYQGVKVNELKASLAKQGNDISLDYVSCLLPNRGSFGVEGTVSPGDKIDIAFYGSEMDLSLIDNLLPETPIAGILDINGTIKGDIDNPIVRAKYAAKEGSIYKQPYDQLHGTAAGSLRGVKVDDFVMEYGKNTKWYAKGMLGFYGDMGIDMRVDTVGARMEDIIQAVAPDQNLTGNVDNVITITGTLKNPHIVGYVHFYQGSYNGIFVNGMDGDYFVQDQVITLQDFHVFTPWLDVDFNGTIDAQSNIDLEASVHEIDLSRYNQYLPIPLTGKAQFSGKLGGTISQPRFYGELAAQGLTANGQELADVGGTVQYSDDYIMVSNLSFAQHGGTYRFDGRVNVQNQGISGSLNVDKGDIHTLIAMAGLDDIGIGGTVSGNMDFSGTLQQPQVQLSAFVEDGFLGSYPLSDVSVSASLDNRKIYINDFSGKEGTNGSFRMNGSVDLDGDLDVNTSLQAIDVGAFTEAAGAQEKVSGTLDMEIHVGGTAAAPRTTIPVAVSNLQFRSTLVDSVVGELVIENRIISVQNLVASKAYGGRTYSLTAEGRVPFAALQEEIPSYNNQFDVNFALDNADLSLLPTISEYIEWAVGPTNGHVRLQGTAARPYLTGNFTVQDGAFKIRDVVKPVTDFNVKMLLTGNTMTVSQCVGTMGSGGFTADGFVHLDGLMPDVYDFKANLADLDVECPVFKGAVNATVDVKNESIPLPRGGEMTVPKVSGRLFLENVLISLPSSLPESSDDMPLVAMDYTVELGKNIRFLSSLMGDLRLAGGAYFGGTTVHPNTSGSIYVQKGTLSYLKTNFKVYEGSLTFGQADTLLPKVVLQAGTRINKTSVYLSLTGPLMSMDFKLLSNPPMSEADIMQLLTLRSDYYNKDQSDGSKLASALNIGLQMTILSEVEAAMNNVLNLDLFTIERGTVDGEKHSSDGSEKNSDNHDYEVYNVVLGKNIADNVMLRYSKSMTTSDYSYGVDYDLTDRVTLYYRRDQDNDYFTGLEARITF